jgi:beta-galactosidase
LPYDAVEYICPAGFYEEEDMARLLGLASILVMLASAAPNAGVAEDLRGSPRITTSFDLDWRFLKSDVPGAEKPDFDDAGWRVLNVPHDWSIEGPFDEKNLTGGAGGFLPAGVGWYRKRFTLPAEYARRRVFIDFDGVMANSDVWINGFHLGRRPYGYVSFRYELTAHLSFGSGRQNILAVRADNSGQRASRWYTGAGIYRHVRLVATGPIHLDHWGTFVSTPRVSAERATVRVQSTVVNQSDATRIVALQVTLIDPDGKAIQTSESKPGTVPAGKAADFELDIDIMAPGLWNLDKPVLYHATTRIRAGKSTLDEDVTPFGIREARFDAATGFQLNGSNLKIKGVCLHHDASALGAAVPLRAWEHRLEVLKKLGVNAVRTAHHPPAPEFLDLCDRMGFLVMDEMFDCWTVAKNPFDYHLYFNEWSRIDTRDTVRRDRNHPSIVVYSAGNEIHDTPQADLARRILSGLVGVFHQNDLTRPVSQGLFRPNVTHDYENGLADLLDVIGQNYRENEILAAHAARSERKILGTENGHERRVWLALRDNAPYSGQFLWSGIDYLGESRGWPVIAAGFGLLDRTGTPRPLAYERQSWWSSTPMVYITRRTAPTVAAPTDPGYELEPRFAQVLFSDWTPRDRNPHDENVEVYSNCDRVELFLNGKSLGSQPRPSDDAPRSWKVHYEEGTLRGVGINKGAAVASHELRSAGKAKRIVLTADREKVAPDWDDLAYVSATIMDENGVLVPGAGDLITFQLKGPGIIAAVDSGDNASHEPFQAVSRRAFQGRCFAILRANAPSGRIEVSASAPGLAATPITIETGRSAMRKRF